jgi:uncharacterized repeat protein (TIGR03803 family)
MTTWLQALLRGGTFAATLPIFTTFAAAQLTTLYTFTGGGDGKSPLSSLLSGKGGVLYGTTHFGGTGNCSLGCGTVYAVMPPSSPGGVWTETAIHQFRNSPGDGAAPYAGVVAGGGGVLYGTTYEGGTSNLGTVYSLTPPGSPGGTWTEALVYSFAGSAKADGANPEGGVVTGAGGALYGTTSYGGTGACSNGCGTVYSLTPPGSPAGMWVETVLYSFSGTPGDGANPTGVQVGKGGVLYGNTSGGGKSGSGTVFSLTPPAAPGGEWAEAILYSFKGVGTGGDGSDPQGSVTINGRGVLYGTTFFGGAGSCAADGCGTVFSLTPPAEEGGAWTEAVVHAFAGGNDGIYPTAGVAIGSGGVLYGATRAGGTGDDCNDGCGTVFSLTPSNDSGGAWTETVIHSFSAFRQGTNPSACVAFGAGGALYGATGSGGKSNSGTVFRLKP